MSRSIGNIQANGGFDRGFNYQSGSLLFIVVDGITGGNGTGLVGHKAILAGGYAVADGGISTDHLLAQGKAIPNSAAEYVIEAIQRKATVIGGDIHADGTMHLIVENNVEGWWVNSSNDGVDAEHPGIVPRPEDVAGDIVPALRKEIRALGILDLNDGGLVTGKSSYDFRVATVYYGDAFKLATSELEEDNS